MARPEWTYTLAGLLNWNQVAVAFNMDRIEMAFCALINVTVVIRSEYGKRNKH